MSLAHNPGPLWALTACLPSRQTPTCTGAFSKLSGIILSPLCTCNLKVLGTVCNFLWVRNWGKPLWWLKNRSNPHSDSCSHRAYRSRSYEITSWLPRRDQASFLNWAWQDGAPSMWGRWARWWQRLLLSGIRTTLWTHPKMTVTPTSIKSHREAGNVISRGHSDKTRNMNLKGLRLETTFPPTFSNYTPRITIGICQISKRCVSGINQERDLIIHILKFKR